MHLPLHIMTLLGRPRREYNNVQVTKTNYHRIYNNYRHSSEVDNRFQQYNMRLCILGRGENKIKIYNTHKKKKKIYRQQQPKLQEFQRVSVIP